MDNYEIQITAYARYIDIDVVYINTNTNGTTKHKLINFGVGICDNVKCYPDQVQCADYDTASSCLTQKEWVVEIRKDMNECILIRKYNTDACYVSITVESNGIHIITCVLKYKRNEIHKLIKALLK